MDESMGWEDSSDDEADPRGTWLDCLRCQISAFKYLSFTFSCVSNDCEVCKAVLTDINSNK